jgi:glycosyltransferase involved in cell wall biosynthesis
LLANTPEGEPAGRRDPAKWPISPHEVTVAIEGWNAQDLDSRLVFERSLRSLAAQTYPLRDCQVLIIVDDSVGESEGAWIMDELPGASILRLRDATYFRSKNLAMKAAKGSVLAFADSDVRYSPPWLELLLGSFKPGVELVAGNTQYEKGLLSTTLSLCDWSATRSKSGPTDWFYGNNLAVKRSVFGRIRFRDDLGRSGGGAVNILRQELQALGVTPWMCAEARAWHHLPPFLEKRLRVGGYQIQFRRKAPETSWSWMAHVPLMAPFLVTVGTLLKTYQRAWRLRSTLPGRGLSLPAYLCSIAFVKSFELAGAALVAWAPRWVSRRYGWFDVPAAAGRVALGEP